MCVHVTDTKHQVPIYQMSDYKDYLSKRPTLRSAEDDASSRRKIVFGNPFKSIRSNEVAPQPGNVDEADVDIQDSSRHASTQQTQSLQQQPQQQTQQPQQPLTQTSTQTNRSEQAPSSGLKRPPISSLVNNTIDMPPVKRQEQGSSASQATTPSQTLVSKSASEIAKANTNIRASLWCAIRTPDSPLSPLDVSSFKALLQGIKGSNTTRKAFVTDLIAQAQAFNALRQLELLREFFQTITS